jgi:glycosyltransferase involved in cell wall biosynthesis
VGATDGIGLSTVIGDAGIFVPTRGPRSLVDAILRLLSDRPLRIKLGQYARSTVVKRHSWKTVAETTTQLFRELVDLNKRLVPARRPL